MARNRQGSQERDEFYPCILMTSPPTLLTREQTDARVPHVRVTHIPATNPRNEDTIDLYRKQSARP